MPATNSKVGLCSEALLMLGSRSITDLDAADDKSAICKKLYETVVANLLSARTWRFTLRKVQLSRLVATPTNGWTYQFQLPSAMLSGPWAVYNSTQAGARALTAYEIFEDKLYSNELVIVIDYQAEPDVSKFPAAFRTLVVYALAAIFAPTPICEHPELAALYDRMAFGGPADDRQGGQFRIAANADSKASPARTVPTDEVTAARFS